MNKYDAADQFNAMLATEYTPEVPPETRDARRIIELHCGEYTPTRLELEQMLRLAWLRGYVAGIEASEKTKVTQ